MDTISDGMHLEHKCIPTSSISLTGKITDFRTQYRSKICTYFRHKYHPVLILDLLELNKFNYIRVSRKGAYTNPDPPDTRTNFPGSVWKLIDRTEWICHVR